MFLFVTVNSSFMELGYQFTEVFIRKILKINTNIACSKFCNTSINVFKFYFYNYLFLLFCRYINFV